MWDCIGTLQPLSENPRNAWNAMCFSPKVSNNLFKRVSPPATKSGFATAIISEVTTAKFALSQNDKNGGYIGVTECFVHSAVPLKPESIAYLSGNFAQDFGTDNADHLYSLSAAKQIPMRWIWTLEWKGSSGKHDKTPLGTVVIPNFQQQFSIAFVCDPNHLKGVSKNIDGNGCNDKSNFLTKTTKMVRVLLKKEALLTTLVLDYAGRKKAFAVIRDTPKTNPQQLAEQLRLVEPTPVVPKKSIFKKLFGFKAQHKLALTPVDV